MFLFLREGDRVMVASTIQNGKEVSSVTAATRFESVESIYF